MAALHNVALAAKRCVMLPAKSVVGRTISHYRILSLLGSGGMGVVFRAEDIRLGREVALKFLPDYLASDPMALERFRREARAASGINHPHICTVYDVGEDDGRPFLVMELLEGKTLKDRLAVGPVLPTEIVAWISQVADALEVAHNSGIIHRDVKPANLFITKLGQAKVLDFGLARTVGLHRAAQDSSRVETATAVGFETSLGQTAGTIAYMSPEQARGEQLDRRTDIFSLGVVMYEMATGQLPFDGNTFAVICDRILNREPPLIQDLNPAFPAELGRIIQKTIAKDRGFRYQSARELGADLDRLKRDGTPDKHPSTVTGAVSLRRKFPTSGAIAIILPLVITIAVLALLLRRKQERNIWELVPTRVTSNNSEAAVQSMSLSPDGKYLAYSDINGVHVRSILTTDSRTLPSTQGMRVHYWAMDATQFFATKLVNEQYVNYKISLTGGVPQALGATIPSPSGRYSLLMLKDHVEVRRETDGKVLALNRRGATEVAWAWSPQDKYMAVLFANEGRLDMPEIAGLNLENGVWTTLVAKQREYIGDLAWLSDTELVYAKDESAPRTDANLWTVKVDLSTGLPTGSPQPRTHWTDFQIIDLATSARSLCFLRRTEGSDIYIGEVQAHGTRLVSVRQLTFQEANNLPYAWMPDGRVLLFASDRDGPWRIYKQDVRKDTADLVTFGTAGVQAGPRISPNGQSLLYWNTMPRQSITQLMKMPLAGGASQEVLASKDPAPGFSCSHVPDGACVVSQRRGNGQVFHLVDPLKGYGPQILATTGEAGRPTISPDGQHIAFVLPGMPQNRIQIIDLRGKSEREIVVSIAQHLTSLDWSVDGTGFFSGDVQPSGTRLLHIERDGGQSQVLWSQAAAAPIWGIASPDGRHIATFKNNVSANVWIIDNPLLMREPGPAESTGTLLPPVEHVGANLTAHSP